MNAQEIFDKVVSHLLTQGCKSYDSLTETCRYRGPNDTKCAIGCLITDEQYRPWMESATLNKLLDPNIFGGPERQYLDAQFAWMKPHQKLLQQLQDCHDGLPPSHWETRLCWIAEQHRLIYTPRAIT